MFHAGIYAILDGDRLGLRTEEAIADAAIALVEYAVAAAQAGAVAVQLRLKSLPSQHPLRSAIACNLALTLKNVAGGRVPLVIDDDLAAARAAQAGLHWGQTDGDARNARQRLGESGLLGWSTHNLQQVDAARDLPVDYLGFGPVRATQSKENPDRITGWAMLADACARARQPVVAIGGLEQGDAVLAVQAGARAMAVIGAWLGPAERVWTPEQAHDAMKQLAASWQAATEGAG